MLQKMAMSMLGNVDIAGIAERANEALIYGVQMIHEMNERQKRIESHLEKLAGNVPMPSEGECDGR